MKKLLVLVLVSVGASLSAVAQQNDTTKSTVNNTYDRGVMFTAYLVVETGFPTNGYTPANSDSYITSVKDWISADMTRYASIINGSSSYTQLKVNWSDYDKLDADGQQAIKEWIASLNGFITMQLTLQDPGKKTVLLSQEDFAKLQMLLSL